MNDTSEKDVELTAPQEQKTEDDRQDSKAQKSLSWRQRIRMFFCFFTVEPFLLCYILPIAISGLAVQKLNVEKACRADLGLSEEICFQVSNPDENNNDSWITAAQVNSSTLVAEMTAWQQPLQSSLPAIVILNVGAWSDKTGNRKLLMLIPILGEIISSIGLLWATYFFVEWPLWATALIQALPPAMTGGYSIALMGSYSLIADMTSIESRTFRIGMVGIIVTLGIPLGTSISGILTEAVGYYGIFSINLVLYTIGFFYTLFRIKNLRTTKIEGTFIRKLLNFFHPINIWHTISFIFFSKKMQIIQIFLIILAHIVIIGPVFGETAILFLYLLNKYSMNAVDFSFFSTYSILMGTVGSAIAVTIFSKKLKMHDSLLGIIATACKTMSAYVYAFAPTRHWLYAAPVFDFFGSSGTIAIRSLGTKVVDEDKVGKMCSIIGFVEAVIPVIYVPWYSTLFSESLQTWPGAVYVLGGSMTIPAFGIFILLYFLYTRERRNVVKNPSVKQQYAHDNHMMSSL